MAFRETTLIFTLSLDCQLHQKYHRIFRYYSITLCRNCSELSTVLKNSEVLPVFQKASYPTCSKTAQCCQNVLAGTCSQAWWPEFHPGTTPHSHRGRTDSHILPSKLHTCAMTCVYPHSYANTRKKISVIVWTVDNCLGVAMGLRKWDE